jgi:hypothetical protein
MSIVGVSLPEDSPVFNGHGQHSKRLYFINLFFSNTGVHFL